MALNRAKKKKIKTYAIIAGVAVVAYYAIFVSAWGKKGVNWVGEKLGISSADKPLLA
jgi:hypothetical protein